MKSPYQQKLESLAHLLTVLSNSIDREVSFECEKQFNFETEVDFLIYSLSKSLQRQVSESEQVIALDFIEQHFNSSLAGSLVNREDKLTIN